MNTFFTIQKFTSNDKTISIDGPDDLRISIDYDDVNQKLVKWQVEEIVDILNRYWVNNIRYV